jgi:hypothetical protein
MFRFVCIAVCSVVFAASAATAPVALADVPDSGGTSMIRQAGAESRQAGPAMNLGQVLDTSPWFAIDEAAADSPFYGNYCGFVHAWAHSISISKHGLISVEVDTRGQDGSSPGVGVYGKATGTVSDDGHLSVGGHYKECYVSSLSGKLFCQRDTFQITDVVYLDESGDISGTSVWSSLHWYRKPNLTCP